MIKQIQLMAAILVIGVMSSCGTGKKLTAANDQIQQLQATNTELNTKVTSLQTQVDNLIAGNKQVNAEFSKYKASCEETQAKFEVTKAILRDQYNTMAEVEKKLEEGMADFMDKGVDVYTKDGMLYVSLQDDLLYKSGSSKLGPEGKQALGSLAAALNDYPKLQVIVVGNTDDKQLKKGGDNWSLSTERANGVVRILRDDYKVDPMRLTSAGKGKYAPVADNTTEEGRARNRRTDIILNPDLTRLWDESKK